MAVVLWGWVALEEGKEAAVLERAGGLVQEGAFGGTGTGVGGERDLWCGVGWGGGFVVAGGT